MVAARSALARKLLRDTWHLRSQLLAVVVVMACGSAMFVSLRSMHGWLRDTQAEYYEAYRFADVFSSVRRAPRDVAASIARVPGVADVRARVVMDVTLDVPGVAEPGTGRLVAIPERPTPILNDLHLRRGRWIRPGAGREVLASEAFARANALEPGDRVPAVLNGRWQQLEVVGIALSPEYVYEIRGAGDLFPDNRRFGVLWMGETALAEAFDMGGAFNDVTVRLAPGASEPEVIAAVDRLLAPFGGTGAYARADQMSHQFLDGEIEETEVTSILLPAIFLGVTAFLLNMVLARLVATQREQVGLLKAFGYGRAAVAGHYLQLGLIPVVLGAAIGSGLGAWLAGGLAGIYARFFQFPDATYDQDPGVLVTGMLVAGGAAVLGALGAVRRAAALPPAEAMRPAAPATYRPGIAERLGIARRVSPATRIILRNLERHPWRTALSLVGIALAAAIVMVGWFMFDAIDVLKRIQFEQVQRHDVMVLFDAPRSGSARWSLGRLPGVRMVEPFRAVPARVSHGHRARRLALNGVQQDAELQRIVDRDLVVHPVPRTGILLSAVIAERLAVRPGDTVTVEVLEGQRPVERLVVSGVVDDVLGASATMPLDRLRDLMHEGGTLDGAFLAVDPASASVLYAALKATPAVSGVVAREAVVRGFEETIAESFWLSISLMVTFACIIAAGVVYNGARVALSERGRELASLRVLGFARREVASLLLGEQALLTVLGFPLGLLLGWLLAWLVAYRFDSELFRIPLIIRPTTIAWSMVVIAGTALVAALAIRRRIGRLDLIAVLKTRE